MKAVKIEEVKKGDYFRMKPTSPVYIRGEYNRSAKRYENAKFDDCLQTYRLIKKGTLVLIDFEF